MFPPVRTVPPVSPPLDVELVRQHCRLDDLDQADMVEFYIDSARDHVEEWKGVTGQALITQTWRQDFRAFDACLRLPIWPVQSVSSVTYYNTSEVSTTLATSVYELLEDELGAYVSLKYGQQWPNIGNTTKAVSVTYVCGYGNIPNNIPADIRHAMMLMISHWYENREATAPTQMAVMEVPLAARALLNKHRRVGF